MISQLWLLLPLFSIVLADSPVVVISSTSGNPFEFTVPSFMTSKRMHPTYYLALENNFIRSSCQVVSKKNGLHCWCSIEHAEKGSFSGVATVCTIENTLRVKKDDGLFECKLRIGRRSKHRCTTELTISKDLPTIPAHTARYPIAPSMDGSYTMKTWLRGSPDWAFPVYMISPNRVSVCDVMEIGGHMHCICYLKGIREDWGKEDIVCYPRQTLAVTREMTELSSYTCSMQMPPTSACFTDLIKEPKKSDLVLPLYPNPPGDLKRYESMGIEALLHATMGDEHDVKANDGWKTHSSDEREAMHRAVRKASMDAKKSSGSIEYERMEGDFVPLDEMSTPPSSSQLSPRMFEGDPFE